MFRISGVVGMAILGMAFLVGTGSSQDKDKKETPKTKGQLPAGWKDLGLTAEQKAAVYKVQATYKAKIQKLEEEIKGLKAEEKTEMVKHLTDAQKEALRKFATGEGAPKKEGEKEKKKTADK